MNNQLEQMKNFVEMSKKPFGKTGWVVPCVSFGGAGISGEGGGYGFGYVSAEQAQELLEFSFHLGINLYDTAPIYGFGLSEQRLGKFFKKNREQVYITSKSGVTWSSSKRVNMTNDPKVTEEMILQSLKDLSTDYIDLYFIHWPDKNVDIRRPLEVLAKYQHKGIIKKVGLCNTNLDDLEKSKEIVNIEVVQCEYNLFQRSFEDTLSSYCLKEGMAFMSWGSLDKGVLTGNYDLKRNYDDYDARKSAPWFKKNDLEKKVLIIDELKKIIPQETKMFDLVCSYYLSRSFLNTQLVGSKSIAQLTDYIKACMKGKDLWESFEHKSIILEKTKNWNLEKK